MLKIIEKRKKLVIIILLILIITLLSMASFGWFSIIVTGNDESTKDVETTTASLSLSYVNGNEIKIEKALPGDIQTKTFSVTNTGTGVGHYNLVWKDLENNFERQNDFTYTITSTNGGGVLAEKSIPISGGHRGIITYITIPANTTQTYTIIVKYKNVNENQVVDEGNTLKGKIEVEDIPWTEPTKESCFTVSGSTITDYDNNCPKVVNIPSTINGTTITEIGASAFINKSLKSVIIPDTITTIGSNAFSTNLLTKITIPNNITSITSYSFYNNSLSLITLPDKFFSIEESFNVNLLSDEDAFIYERNSNGTYNKNVLVSYGGAKKINVIVPSNITTLGYRCFAYNKITSITLPSDLQVISGYTFYGNSFTTITIPSTVTSIASKAFVKASGTNTQLQTIVNKTGRSFDWGLIVNNSTGYNFVTGTVVNSLGNVTVTDS